MVLDAEKDRPFLKDLLPLADYVICNRNFPQAFTGRYGVYIISLQTRSCQLGHDVAARHNFAQRENAHMSILTLSSFVFLSTRLSWVDRVHRLFLSCGSSLCCNISTRQVLFCRQ